MEAYHLVNKLMKLYCELEDQTDGEYLYYCHTEFDSYVSKFEGMSNSNKIVMKTKISIKYIPLLMQLFQAIYDNNIDIITDIIYQTLLEIHTDADIREQTYGTTKWYNDRENLLDQYNPNIWFNMIEHIVESYKPIITNDKIVGIEGELVYYEIPDVELKYYPRNRELQKVYTLNDIYELSHVGNHGFKKIIKKQ